jgi:hypothetical protein
MNQLQNEEVDILKFFKTLWDGKWFITTFVVLTVLVSYFFLYNREPEYASKLVYTSMINKTNNNLGSPLRDFQKKFYSKRIFNDWKESVGKTSLAFNQFNANKVVDGYVFSVNKSSLIQFISRKESYILIKTNQLPLINDVFKYSKYITELLNKDYIFKLKNISKMVIKRSKTNSLQNLNESAFNVLWVIDRLNDELENGGSILEFQYPTVPKTHNTIDKSILFTLSIILGGVIGIFFVLILNAIRKHKESLTKS